MATISPGGIASASAWGTAALVPGVVLVSAAGVVSREQFGDLLEVNLPNMARLIARVRMELGDLGEPFRDTFQGTGQVSEYDLSVTNVAQLSVAILLNGIWRDLAPGEYSADRVHGVIYLAEGALANGATLIVSGTAQGIFTDAELTTFILEAVAQHTHNTFVTTRYKDDNNMIHVARTPVTLANVPEIEIMLIALLATTEALWTIATDTSTDVDIATSEGTHIARSQRYRQAMAQIDAITARYRDLCAQLNVGLHRIEMFDLRRVSRTTGRLVPLFAAREYDDTTLPMRELVSVDEHEVDTSGIASPAGWW